jgi:hypothetical protein
MSNESAVDFSEKLFALDNDCRRAAKKIKICASNFECDAKCDENYAADAVAVRSLVAGAVSPSQRTLTILDTPGSCIVTP